MADASAATPAQCPAAAHQIGLGPLVDGDAACHARFLPFCF